MGETTAIEWTRHTFNPWVGCMKVSDGCKHCYAETLNKRWGRVRWGAGAKRERTSEANWKQPLRWNAAAKKAGVRARVFCASMADVFDPEVPREWRGDLFALIDRTPWLDWQLLTKRPEHFNDMAVPHGWPPNVWLGVSVENQEQADRRIPPLLLQRASVRFLSCEPLLGPVDFNACAAWHPGVNGIYLEGIAWVIVGGESGPGARPFDIAWARTIRDQCKASGVACFVKQLGAKPLDGRPLDERISRLAMGARDHLPPITDKKGGDWSEWPADLRVREFPGAA
jgi:protein gp37